MTVAPSTSSRHDHDIGQKTPAASTLSSRRSSSQDEDAVPSTSGASNVVVAPLRSMSNTRITKFNKVLDAQVVSVAFSLKAVFLSQQAASAFHNTRHQPTKEPFSSGNLDDSHHSQSFSSAPQQIIHLFALCRPWQDSAIRDSQPCQSSRGCTAQMRARAT